MSSGFSRRESLENLIRSSADLISQLQENITDSDNILEKRRNTREIERQQGLIREFLKEYIAMWKRLKFIISDDIKEVITSFEEYASLDLDAVAFSAQLDKSLSAPQPANSITPPHLPNSSQTASLGSVPSDISINLGVVTLLGKDFDELAKLLLEDDRFIQEPRDFLIRAGLPRSAVFSWSLNPNNLEVIAERVLEKVSAYGSLEDLPYHALGAIINRLMSRVGPEKKTYLETLILRYRLTRLPQLITDINIMRPAREYYSYQESFSFNLASDYTRRLEAMHEPEKWFQDVSFLIKGAQSMKAVCRVETRNDPLGTGFLVAPDLVLTNYHVLEASPGNTLDEKAHHLNFHFGYMKDGNRTITGKLVKAANNGNALIRHSPVEELDYALIKLGEEAGSENKFGFLKVAPRDIVPGEAALVMQHPEGQPMKFLSNVVVGYLPERKRVHYLTGTLAGSSGSPVFDGDWQVIALHHSGSPVPELPPELDISANEGITMKAIYEDLKDYLTVE